MFDRCDRLFLSEGVVDAPYSWMSGPRPLLESGKELEEAQAAVKVSWSVLLYEEFCRSYAQQRR
jgi:hypothetical protein